MLDRHSATAGNAIIQRTKSRVGRGFFNSIYGVFNKIVEPRVVIKSFENYDPNGILTRAYNEITRGETAASLQYIQLVEKFDDYFKTNKKYRKRLTSEYITVAGAELAPDFLKSERYFSLPRFFSHDVSSGAEKTSAPT